MKIVFVPPNTTPDLDSLIEPFFGSADRLAEFHEVTPGELPEPYRRLLDHDGHMTVTLEKFHGGPVRLELLDRLVTNTHYARNTLLRRESDDRLVQFGIARLAFAFLPDEVREEIEQARIPMGRVLIQHNVLRTVRVTGLWRLNPGPRLSRIFGGRGPVSIYGRTALIYCTGDPAVEVLEVMPPGIVPQDDHVKNTAAGLKRPL